MHGACDRLARAFHDIGRPVPVGDREWDSCRRRCRKDVTPGARAVIAAYRSADLATNMVLEVMAGRSAKP